jgi:hypothetical protein
MIVVVVFVVFSGHGFLTGCHSGARATPVNPESITAIISGMHAVRNTIGSGYDSGFPE